MSHPQASVIMPAFNSAATLPRALDSVRSQTLSDWEVLVVDDCSSDETAAILSQLASKDARIKVFKNENRLGPVGSRNRAIEKSTGRYIAFLDSDDQWLPQKLQIQLDHMKNRNLDLCYGSYWVQTPSGKRILRSPPAELNYSQMLSKNHIGCLTAIYDSQRMGKIKLPNIPKRHDYALWLELLRRGARAGAAGTEALAVYHKAQGSSPSLSQNKFAAATYNWKLYRELEKLSLPRSLMAFGSYAAHGIWDELRMRFSK